MRNILQYLEQTVQTLPEKAAFLSESEALTFRALYEQARSVGSRLIRLGAVRQNVAVLMGKRPKTVAAFLGVIYAGSAYVPLDPEMPRERLQKILRTVRPAAVICDGETAALGNTLGAAVLDYDAISSGAPDKKALLAIRQAQLDIDPVYIVFTSGSTGDPKGVIGCHRGLIDYIENLCPVLDIREDTVFGNQTPFYVDACLKEILPTLKLGASTVLIPRQLFLFPVRLVEFLNKYRINTLCWVVSALTHISSLGAFDTVIPQYLRTVAFASEVFPIRQFNLWKRTLPHVRFLNLYGPTETTGICCYYEVNREFSEDEVLPIGRPFPNTEILLLDENDRTPAPGQQGEICIRGTRLTLGYFGNPQKTREAFTRNPLNPDYPELLYRTGDLGRINSRGELEFLSRKDFQIKHMGHRIELGEIEAAAGCHPSIRACCCLYDSRDKKIWLFYEGNAEEAALSRFLREKLPRYMLPGKYCMLSAMPTTPNGKIDRNRLKKEYLT